MISANVTVAGMVGAATNVSSLDAYMGIFDRVLEGLSIPLKSFDAVTKKQQKSRKPLISGDEIAELKLLYEFRNDLVHEIDISILGHPNIRDSWSPDDAIRIGEIVCRLMKGLEDTLTKRAPRDFPNLLDADFRPVSRYDVVLAELPKLEAQLQQLVTELADNPNLSVDDQWEQAKAAASTYLAAEEEFLEQTPILHSQYEDLRSPLKCALVQSRYAYLKAILDVLG
jgi:hypothetical protein